MSKHLHFSAGLYDTLSTKDRLFSWTCPVTPQDDSLHVVVIRFVLPFVITSYSFLSLYPHVSFQFFFFQTLFLNYRLFKNLEENHYFLELERSLLTAGPTCRVSEYIDFDNCWYHQHMRHL